MQTKKIEKFTLEDITSQFHPQGRKFPLNAIYYAKIAYNRAVKTNLQNFLSPKNSNYKAIVLLPSNNSNKDVLNAIESILQNTATKKVWNISHHTFQGTFKRQNYYWSKHSIAIFFEETSSLYTFCYELSKTFENTPLLIKKDEKIWLFTLSHRQNTL